MTISPHLINSGTPFVSADILPAQDVNNQTDNGILAWLNSAGILGKSVTTEQASNSTVPTAIYTSGDLPVVSKKSYDSVEGHRQVIIHTDGATTNIETATYASVGPHVFSQYSGKWYLFRNFLTTTWYRSSTQDMSVIGVTGTFSSSIFSYAATDTFPSNVVFVAGEDSTGNGKVIKITDATASNYFTHPSYSAFRSIAAYYNVDTAQICAVAVADDGVIYTIDGGATWSNGTMPTIPAAWNNAPLTVVYHQSWGYILSGATTDGKAFFTFSQTGASWGAVSQTPRCIWGTPPVTDLTCGIAAVGNVLCCPWVGSGTAGDWIVGFMASIDNGASWYPAGRGAKFYGLEFLRCLNLGTRIAIVSNTDVVISAPLVSDGVMT